MLLRKLVLQEHGVVSFHLKCSDVLRQVEICSKFNPILNCCNNLRARVMERTGNSEPKNNAI